MNRDSRTPGVSQPLWKCWFQPDRVSRGGNVFDGNEQDGKKWRGAPRQTRLKWWALLWAPHMAMLPLPRAGETTSPQTRGGNQHETGLLEQRGSSCMSEQYIFSKESTFSKQPSKRHDLLHTTALSTTWSVWNFPSFCASAMSSKKQTKRKKTFQILRKSV